MVLPEMMSAWTEGLISVAKKPTVLLRWSESRQGLQMQDNVGGANLRARKKAVPVRFFCGVGILGLARHPSDKDLTSFVIVLAAERAAGAGNHELHQQLCRIG